MPCLACPREQGTFTPTPQQGAAAVSAAHQLLGMCGGQAFSGTEMGNFQIIR